jgi:hypothetical protein
VIIIYAPQDGAEQTFDVGPGRLRASEIQVIERTAGARWDDIKQAMGEGDLNAMRTVVWALLRREQPALRFAEFDPFEGELRSRLDEREGRAYAERLHDKYRDNPEDLAAAFNELRDVVFDREALEVAIADVTAPKDSAPAEPLAEAAEPKETAPSPIGS